MFVNPSFREVSRSLGDEVNDDYHDQTSEVLETSEVFVIRSASHRGQARA